ncbi:hypothetical protein Pcinc_033276 [Petrolisthes cinctipes]|uniref:Multiple epidermal growth factor-like domains protein 8 n=1 Tax=Petrolisthes cinctipes TaxID=88211 RepID=A0AAE1ESK1_PETCI|nr:hypothetical protein Pcinc_033276 [Petrolisthes cinctipes]
MWARAVVVVLVVVAAVVVGSGRWSGGGKACNRTRQVVTGSWGVITDGPQKYPEASHCQWLITAPNPGQYITLNVTEIETECSYDHLYVYDGQTFDSPLLGVFSGRTRPPQVTAGSGHMLVLLYSDTNYVLEGFVAEYSITDCPLNCSSRGECVNHQCECDTLYSGAGCEYERCPENCGMTQNHGSCSKPPSTHRDPDPPPYCQCDEGYYGDGCSLSKLDNEGGTWHWLWRGGPPFNARTSHSSVYLPHLDRLYIYGGYDLNRVMGDLFMFDFGTSVWVNMSDPGSQSQLSHRQHTQRTARLKVMTRHNATAPRHHNATITSFLRNVDFAVNNNNTVSLKRKSPTDATRVGDIFTHTMSSQHPLPIHTTRQTSWPDENEHHHSATTRKKRMIRPSEELNQASSVHSLQSSSDPGPRFGHCMERYERHIVLFGGKTASGVVSNELWLYNTTVEEWHRIAPPPDNPKTPRRDPKDPPDHHSNTDGDPNTPPGLMYATLTLVNVSQLYLFGGSLSHGEFSSRMYRIDLKGERVWEKVVVRGGNELEARVVGHSTVYHASSHSLLVYGGIRVDIARFSKLSDHLLVFDVERQYWSRLHYPKHSTGRYPHVPLERAFHAALIAGDYMVIFGGYLHKHKEEERCYDNKLYLYHLGCHVWMSHQLTPAKLAGVYPKAQGVYGHSASIRGGNTLVVVGGFHGTVNGQVLAYVLPAALVPPAGRSINTDLACRTHVTMDVCVSNPECGWCPSDISCYARSRGANCTNNLQTSHCPGVCPTLHSCQSCALHARLARGSGCAWCVQAGRCRQRVEGGDGGERCGTPEDNPLGQEGWWGKEGLELTTAEQCQHHDMRPGVTVVHHRHPVDRARPDHVAILNATAQDLRDTQEFRGARDLQAGGTALTRFLTFIHPLGRNRAERSVLIVFVEGPSVNVSLWLSEDETGQSLQLVARAVKSKSVQETAIRPGGGPLFGSDPRYLAKLEVSREVGGGGQTGMVRLVWGSPDHHTDVLPYHHLEPYNEGGGACAAHPTCLACLTDALCGWCGPARTCVPRLLRNSGCSSETGGGAHYFTLEPQHCPACHQHIYCKDCVESQECEWLPDEAYCARLNRFPGAVTNVSACPAPCHQRTTCATCLGDPGRCAWCQHTHECFLFSVYTSLYQYGSCRAWLDEDHTNITTAVATTTTASATTATLPPSVASSKLASGGVSILSSECHVCESHRSCESCLEALTCGWCHSVFNPTIGVCTAGDFSDPHKADCQTLVEPLLHAALENVTIVGEREENPSTEILWAYATCPDVDECKLGLHNCHSNATCTNTHPGFNCTCNKGFRGNGRDTCKRTCYESCVHGYCSGHPKYKCECNLGWTGEACDSNCGCNNHSTCNEGVGLCDQCQDWTSGDYCHLCQPGSFGNATTEGCRVCDCNGHWDETAGQCDQDTGQCFCLHNTHGHNCHKCLPGFYGDPRNGGQCYRECHARNLMFGANSGHLGAQTTGLSAPTTCMWVLTPFLSLTPPFITTEAQGVETMGAYTAPVSSFHTEPGEYLIQLTVEESNVVCSEGVVYIYDGLPDFVSSDRHNKTRIVAALCDTQATYPITIEATSGFMTVYYQKGHPVQGFNASYQVIHCGNLGEKHVCQDNKPVCKERWRGVHCELPVCPNKCSETQDRGRCHADYGQCVCKEGFVGEDCSIIQEDHQVVVTQLLVPEKMGSHSNYLSRVLPRMGHSLVVDHHGSLWVFAGYSLSHGPLNDIQQFNTRNTTSIWQQVTVTVQLQRHQLPPARYFHAAAWHQREMYVYGGLNQTTFLSDFWRFNIEKWSWSKLETHNQLPALAGHTLTYRTNGDTQSLVLIGGASSNYGFLESVWEYDLKKRWWGKLQTSGAVPVGIYGHSTVYHEDTTTFYVYGGYSYKVYEVNHFADLYALDYTRKKWSVLPPDSQTNQNPASLPAPRTFHAAITTKDYMVILGGDIRDHRKIDQGLLVYSYKCNMWIPLNSRFITLAGHTITPRAGTAAAIAGNAIYLFGGYHGTLDGSLTQVDIPADLCTLNANQTQCRDVIGCANCVVYHDTGNNSSYCYSNTGEEPKECRMPTGKKNSVVGVRCDARLVDGHDCYQHDSCTACLAEWPAHPHSKQRCQWCHTFSQGRCIPRSGNCSKEDICKAQVRDGSSSGCHDVKESHKCNVGTCVASDCDKCHGLQACIWTRQVLRQSGLGHYNLEEKPSINNWNCVNTTIQQHLSYPVESSPPGQCPLRCHNHTTCTSCLNATGAEGGWHKCYWSPFLKECLAPSYVPLRCVGGTCGLVLTGGPDQCPQPCGHFTQCSQCLAQPQCGWCSLNTEIGGLGICAEGLLEGPRGDSCRDMNFSPLISNTTMVALHGLRQNARLYPKATREARPEVSWNYAACPPENECFNGHHTCDNRSQVCVDRVMGYDCVCAPGYNMTEEGHCIPVCSQGCVYGSCVQPDNCTCNFGYVGHNCSIKCQCNGHSNCAGPDQLDVCTECFNNTMGDQCQKCKPLYVVDPHNSGQCISCFEYCNHHSNVCIDPEFLPMANLSEVESVSELMRFLNISEGPRKDAVCLNCVNFTSGPHCDDCLPGYFRGCEDPFQPCRPCECNGHGTTCNTVWGTDCNCSNNTDTQCTGSKGRGGGGDKEEDKYCWQQQCAKCKDSYLGSPSNGHQCYRQMNVEKDYCLDPFTQNECTSTPTALGPATTVFFAVQPKFMNVDIRLVLDVTQGGTDVYFSSDEDTFVVSLNTTTGRQEVQIDHKFSQAMATTPIRLGAPLTRGYMGPVIDHGAFSRAAGRGEIPTKNRTLYQLVEVQAEGLKTFATVSRSTDILVVRNVTNRLVITLPQHHHDLRSAKFYVAVFGIGLENEPDTLGSIFFRQDQPRIDLFVFFSVFFSCFFLFLAVCVVVWKIKQGVDLRRARRRHVVEMLHMAKRPCAATTLVLQNDDSEALDPLDLTPDPALWSPARRKRTTKKDRCGDGFNVGPLAVEPTDDGVAAVLTVMVQLPGGGIGTPAPPHAPTHRLALGSSLCLMSRIFPPATRPFHLRRRTSHMAT